MTGPLQALAARYDRLVTQGEVPAYGFSRKEISYALVLALDGSLVDVQPLLDTTGKKPQPTPRLVPAEVDRSSNIASNFLWDKTSYALGVSATESKCLKKHNAFKALHANLLAGTNDDGLLALLAFLGIWHPECFMAAPFAADMLDKNLIFRLDGDDLFLHERPAARVAWLTWFDRTDALHAMCLVTGQTGPIARLHRKIMGVRGAQSSGAPLVSFDKEAFRSYGKEQGANAPVSEAAAFAYATMLNALLAKGSRNNVRVGDTTVVFWAEREEAERVARGFFDPPGPDEKGEAARVRAVLEEMAKGRPIEQVDPKLDPATRFYILGLAPNAARLSVRFWLETDFGDLARHFAAWWRDLRIEPEPWNGRLPALWRLLFELAPQGKAENVPAYLAGELTRAVLTGGRLPRALLAAAVMRLRADSDPHPAGGRRGLAAAVMRLRADSDLNRDQIGRRAAILKAVLARDLRLAGVSLGENHLVSLDPDDPNPGYRLGRLFAVLENVQRSALGRNVNATIRDRYYGAASATPASVFPVLIRNANHHLANLRKTGKGGLAFALEREMGGILDGLGSAFPRNLHLEDQGRFAIGYYHERFSRASALPDGGEPPADDADTTAEEA